MSIPPENIPGSSNENMDSGSSPMSSQDVPSEAKVRKLLLLREKLRKRKKELDERDVDWDNESLEDRLYNEELEVSKTLVEMEKKLIKYRVIKGLPEECKILLNGGVDLTVVITDTGDELLNERLTTALKEKCTAKNSAKLGIYLDRDELEKIFEAVREEQLARGQPKPLPPKEDRTSFEELMRNVSSVINRSVKEARFSKGPSLFEDYLNEEDKNNLAANEDVNREKGSDMIPPSMDLIMGAIRERGEEERRNGGYVEEEGEDVELSDIDDEKEDDLDEDEEEKCDATEGNVGERDLVEDKGEDVLLKGGEEPTEEMEEENEPVEGNEEQMEQDREEEKNEENSMEHPSLAKDGEDNASIVLSSDGSTVDGGKKDDGPLENLKKSPDVVTLEEDSLHPPVRQPDQYSGYRDEFGRRLGFDGFETIAAFRDQEPIASSSNKENADAGFERWKAVAREDDIEVTQLELEVPPATPPNAEQEDGPEEPNDEKKVEVEVIDTPDNISLTAKPSWLKGETSAELAERFVSHNREVEDDLEVIFERIAEVAEPKYQASPELVAKVQKWMMEGGEALAQPVPLVDLSDDDEVQEKAKGAEEEREVVVEEKKEEDRRRTKRAASDVEGSPAVRRPRVDEAGPSTSA